MLAFAALGGCGTLPTIVPDMAAQRARPVRLESARGPLSAQQSKAILERLKNGGEETSIFDRHLALEQGIADSPLLVGNKVALLRDGPSTYKAMFAAIRSATDYVLMETYIIEDDDVGRQFSDALIERRARGVEVVLLYDSVGSFSTPKEFFKRLTDASIKVQEFNPVNPLSAKNGWQVNQRDHRKLLVVDGRLAFVGGINISSVYSSGSNPGRRGAEGNTPWRDTHLQLEGPVVAEYRKLFAEAWDKQKGDALSLRGASAPAANAGREVVRAIGSSPDDPYSLIYATLISAINSSESSIYLTNAYFVPDPQLLSALISAAQRGVDVKIVLPGKTDSSLVLAAGRSYYEELLRGGVKIYERRDALLHAKTAVIDGVWSTIGSTNLDWRSFLHNHEINAVVLSPDFGAQMQAMFDADISASDPISLQKWQQRPLSSRVSEMTARLWSRWL